MKELTPEELTKLGARNLDYVYSNPVKTDYKEFRPKEQSVKINVKKMKDNTQTEENTEVSSGDLIELD